MTNKTTPSDKNQNPHAPANVADDNTKITLPVHTDDDAHHPMSATDQRHEQDELAERQLKQQKHEQDERSAFLPGNAQEHQQGNRQG